MTRIAVFLVCLLLPGIALASQTGVTEWDAMVARDGCIQFCVPEIWQHEINLLRKEPAPQQFVDVNNFINTRFPYQYTSKQWRTPVQLEQDGHGDCVDHAVGKMALLIAAGFPSNKTALVILQDTKHHYTHAVLEVADGTGWKYLDDQFSNVLTVIPDYYHPIYSINFDGWKLLDPSLALNKTIVTILD